MRKEDRSGICSQIQLLRRRSQSPPRVAKVHNHPETYQRWGHLTPNPGADLCLAVGWVTALRALGTDNLEAEQIPATLPLSFSSVRKTGFLDLFPLSWTKNPDSIRKQQTAPSPATTRAKGIHSQRGAWSCSEPHRAFWAQPLSSGTHLSKCISCVWFKENVSYVVEPRLCVFGTAEG